MPPYDLSSNHLKGAVNSIAVQAAAERTWFAISRFYDNCKYVDTLDNIKRDSKIIGWGQNLSASKGRSNSSHGF